MTEPLTPKELKRLRAEAEAEAVYPGKHGQWERLVLRLLAALAAERAASQGDSLDVERLTAILDAIEATRRPGAYPHLGREADRRRLALDIAREYAALAAEEERA